MSTHDLIEQVDRRERLAKARIVREGGRYIVIGAGR